MDQLSDIEVFKERLARARDHLHRIDTKRFWGSKDLRDQVRDQLISDINFFNDMIYKLQQRKGKPR